QEQHYSLELFNCRNLKQIPTDILNAKLLTIVSIRSTSIENIPIEFSDLINIVNLTLAKNKITELPDNIFSKMDKLSYLDLCDNGLIKIPESISSPPIITLLISNNDLIDISQLKNCKELST